LKISEQRAKAALVEVYADLSPIVQRDDHRQCVAGVFLNLLGGILDEAL